MSRTRGRVTVHVMREDGTSWRRFRLAPVRVGGLAAVLLVLLAGTFFAGWRASSLRTPARIAELEGQADSLRAETAKVGVLAASLARVETSYERLRQVMSAEVEPSARDILLPAVDPSGREMQASRRRAEVVRGPVLWPLVEAGFVTRAFGDTSALREGGHAGLDVAVPSGSYVRAAGPGVVVETGADREYGRYVRIDHGEGIRSLYAHASWVFASPGDTVEAGEVIALSGSTGRSTAPHLHLEIERNGRLEDPLPWVTGRL
ncbi:MAG: M23 family metallopeptidase [Gemmatimonadota bacterium]|jgi:murein DD-endopeptidase MepM/ murein hydrolase activator NlpD